MKRGGRLHFFLCVQLEAISNPNLGKVKFNKGHRGRKKRDVLWWYLKLGRHAARQFDGAMPLVPVLTQRH